MRGLIGRYLKAAADGDAAARDTVQAVFTTEFRTTSGWRGFLDKYLPGQVTKLLDRRAAWWSRGNFQALYVACWIFHPVEKGSYMLQLEAAPYANMKEAYLRLLADGRLQSRISSHLSKTGASAHLGWSFLQGYEELLIQMEGEKTSCPYLFLKCEGHALDGPISSAKHLWSWLVKNATGAGATASPALKEFAEGDDGLVEARAAENFSGTYKDLHKALGLSGKLVTVADVVDALWTKCGFRDHIPANIKGDNRLLGQNMLGQLGFIKVFERQRSVLKQEGVDFTPEFANELRKLAERLVSTGKPHARQHYHEIRVTATELDQALAVFNSYVPN
jgi:hypothetical protein